MRVSRARRGNVRPVDAQRRRITSDCRLSLENRRSEFFDRAGRLHRHIITVNQRARKTFNEIRFIRHNGKLTARNTRCVVCHIDCAVENAARYCVTRRSIHVHGGFAADCSVADIDVAESGTYTESVFATADDGFFTRNINHSVCADRDTVFFCSGESAAADGQRHFFARVQRRFAFKRAAADIGVDVAHQIHRVCDSGEITRRDGQLGVVIGIQSVNRFRSIDVLRSRLHKRAAVDGHFVAVLHGVVLAVGESAAVDGHDAFGIVFDSVESAVERAAVDDDFKRIGGSNEPLVCRFIVGIVITADKQTAFVAAVAVNNNAAFLIFFTDDQRTVVLDDIPSARPRGFTGKLAAEKRRVAVVEQSRIAVRRDDYFAAAHTVGNDHRAVIDNSVVALTRQRKAVEVDGDVLTRRNDDAFVNIGKKFNRIAFPRRLNGVGEFFINDLTYLRNAYGFLFGRRLVGYRKSAVSRRIKHGVACKIRSVKSLRKVAAAYIDVGVLGSRAAWRNCYVKLAAAYIQNGFVLPVVRGDIVAVFNRAHYFAGKVFAERNGYAVRITAAKIVIHVKRNLSLTGNQLRVADSRERTVVVGRYVLNRRAAGRVNGYAFQRQIAIVLQKYFRHAGSQRAVSEHNRGTFKHLESVGFRARRTDCRVNYVVRLAVEVNNDVLSVNLHARAVNNGVLTDNGDDRGFHVARASRPHGVGERFKESAADLRHKRALLYNIVFIDKRISHAVNNRVCRRLSLNNGVIAVNNIESDVRRQIFHLQRKRVKRTAGNRRAITDQRIYSVGAGFKINALDLGIENTVVYRHSGGADITAVKPGYYLSVKRTAVHSRFVPVLYCLISGRDLSAVYFKHAEIIVFKSDKSGVKLAAVYYQRRSCIGSGADISDKAAVFPLSRRLGAGAVIYGNTVVNGQLAVVVDNIPAVAAVVCRADACFGAALESTAAKNRRAVVDKRASSVRDIIHRAALCRAAVNHRQCSVVDDGMVALTRQRKAVEVKHNVFPFGN